VISTDAIVHICYNKTNCKSLFLRVSFRSCRGRSEETQREKGDNLCPRCALIRGMHEASNDDWWEASVTWQLMPLSLRGSLGRRVEYNRQSSIPPLKCTGSILG